jgi:hypothetical protein
MANITCTKHLNPGGGTGPTPGWSSEPRHNSYRVKLPGDHGIRHPGPATISLVNLRQLTLAA